MREPYILKNYKKEGKTTLEAAKKSSSQQGQEVYDSTKKRVQEEQVQTIYDRYQRPVRIISKPVEQYPEANQLKNQHDERS